MRIAANEPDPVQLHVHPDGLVMRVNGAWYDLPVETDFPVTSQDAKGRVKVSVTLYADQITTHQLDHWRPPVQGPEEEPPPFF